MSVYKPKLTQALRPKRRHEFSTDPTTAGNRLIESVSRAATEARQTTSRAAEHRDQLIQHNRGDRLYKWLKAAEKDKAHPLMQAIKQAEQIRNRRLCVQMNHELVLTSRGFRFVAVMRRSPIMFWFGPDPTVMAITQHRVRKCIDPYVPHEKVEQEIQAVLDLPDVNQRLVYMGVDEWPTHCKVLWGALSAATLGTAIVASMAYFYAHEEDYSKRMTAVL